MKMQTGLALKLVVYFARHYTVVLSTQDIMRRYNVTSLAVRHALHIMVREGLLKIMGKTEGRTRYNLWGIGPKMLEMIENDH